MARLPARLPFVSSLDPQEFSDGVVTKGPTSVNVAWSAYADKRGYATQRPAIDVIGVASTKDVAKKGRGIVYWDKVAGEGSNGIYFVNNDTVYAGSYENPLASKITGGRDPVYFVEVGEYLILLDPQNNQGWYLGVDSPEQIFKISDKNFPGVTNGAKLAGGGAELNGYLFVMDTDGVIYNSNLNDPTTYSALDFIEAQREQDAGVFLTKHHDNVVAISGTSIEFFYDAGNASGSPLGRRTDIAYRTGALDYRSCFTSGERIYFIGSEKIGTPGLYEIAGYQLKKVSTDSIDRFIGNTRAVEKFLFNMTGAYIGEHYYIFINTLDPSDSDVYSPKYTFWYDATHNLWGEFRTKIASIDAFAMAGISERSMTARKDSVILFMSGDLAVFNTSGAVRDTSGEGDYIEDDFIENQRAWVESGVGEETETIQFEVVLNEQDLGSMRNKFMSSLSLVGTTVGSEEDKAPLLVSWSDDVYRSFSSPRFLPSSLHRQLRRLGKFKRRAFKVNYTGNDRLRIEALEIGYQEADYA